MISTPNKMNTKSHINPYFILDCGGSGNCLYYCIAEALNNVLVQFQIV